MPLIKRYPNRKLYDTEAKRYITREGIASLIQQGCEIQVLDHATGDDLTAVTLTQVIADLEKKRGGFVPHTVLAGLIQSSGDRFSALQRYLASQFDLLHSVDEEIKRRMKILIRRGEFAESDGNHVVERLLDLGLGTIGDQDLPSDDEIEQILEILNKRGIPTRSDLEQLMAQLDRLAAELETLTDQK